ncbi:MAG: glutamate formimidoyltransferase [Acidobacteria bacterium]|nr:glutamate formimidoyltransferase [Acidobacteriota bacterium]
MSRLVECVMNFSEGRDQAILDQIAASIAAVAGVALLDRHQDAAHHRCVISFAGPPEAVEQAAVDATGKAAELIDLTRHRGEHPRIGATDVIPFVPLQEMTLEECVAMARRTGAEIARRFEIPVYLYGAAATRPGRRDLAAIRRGGFERLREEIATCEARIPDFGERRVHPSAGATAVGARAILIAYNVYLDTEDIGVAREIARAVRSSSGGLPSVKALGFRVPARKQTQVSMNLVDYRETSLWDAFEAVRREAERHGVWVASSEIVGLVPQDAIWAAVRQGLKIENFSREHVLEQRLRQSLRESHAAKTVAGFLDSLAAAEPVPAGGSAAAMAVALAGGLALMVCRVSARRKSGEMAAKFLAIQRLLQRLQDRALALVDEDSQAVEQIIWARRAGTGEARDRAIQQCLRHATEVPMETAALGHSMLRHVDRLCDIGARELLSEVGTAAAMAQAGVRSAAYSVRVNLAGLLEAEFARTCRERLQTLLRESEEMEMQIRMKMSPGGQ